MYLKKNWLGLHIFFFKFPSFSTEKIILIEFVQDTRIIWKFSKGPGKCRSLVAGCRRTIPRPPLAGGNAARGGSRWCSSGHRGRLPGHPRMPGPTCTPSHTHSHPEFLSWPGLPARSVAWTLKQEHKVNLIMERLCLLKAACTHPSPSPSPRFPRFQNKLQHLFLSRFTGAFVYDLPVISCVSSCVFVTKRVGGILLTRSRERSNQ